MHTFCAWPCISLPAAGLSSRSRLRSTKGGRLYTRRNFGPRPGSVARGLGVLSLGELALFEGSPSAEPKPTRTMETRTNKKDQQLFFSRVLLCVTARTSRDSHVTTAASPQAFPFRGGNEPCFCMFLRVCACVWACAVGPTSVPVHDRMLGTRNTKYQEQRCNFSFVSSLVSLCCPPLLLSAAAVRSCCTSISITQSSPSAAATVLQQPHFKVFPWREPRTVLVRVYAHVSS